MPGSSPSYLAGPAHFGKPGTPKWLNALRLWLWLWRELREAQIVHIHGALGWPTLIAGIACTTRGTPFVISAHGALYPWYLERQPWKMHAFLAVLGRRFLRAAHRIIANTPAEADVVVAYEPRARISVIPPGIEMPEGAEQPKRSATGARDGIRPLRAVFLGRIEPMKGLSVLVEAASLLRRNGVAIHFDLVGEDVAGHARELRVLAERLDVTPSISFHGYVSQAEKSHRLRNADLLVMPSYAEAFNFATAEALALGLPAVVTESVALAETVREYECGTVVPTGDANALAIALARYADLPTRTRQAENATRCAQEKFSLAAMGHALMTLYREVLTPG
jgi:glycosyltransferase involved in cell wall biosynthesis